MDGRPLASVIINNYNYGRYLGEAIRSALAQTYAPVEVVVVDDGSTDDSREVIASFGERVLPVLKDNGGQGSAFNAGFAACRGPIVIFLDADDALLPTAAEAAVERMREPGVVKVHWRLWEVDAEGRRTGRALPIDELPDGDLREFTLREGPSTSVSPATSGNAWARGYLERILPMPESEHRISADAYLFGLAPAFGLVRSLDEPEGLYRVHGRNHYRGTPFEERMRANLSTLEQQWRVSARRARATGIAADPAEWQRRSYFQRLCDSLHEIERLIPPGNSFVLLDEEQWGSDETVVGRRRIPFLERDGVFNGRPSDDAHAVAELERLRAERGATHLVVAWSAFWWLDCYTGFTAHLHDRYRRVLENDRIVVFELTS
jgi:glycosyltransferase involved in cell wall biosynthesis